MRASADLPGTHLDAQRREAHDREDSTSDERRRVGTMTAGATTEDPPGQG
jgi:hypothetical protein